MRKKLAPKTIPFPRPKCSRDGCTRTMGDIEDLLCYDCWKGVDMKHQVAYVAAVHAGQGERKLVSALILSSLKPIERKAKKEEA
jgi:hypothetical protein